MKALLIGVLVFGAFALGWWVRGVEDARKGGAGPIAAPSLTPAERAAVQAKADQCRDQCDQRNVIEKLGDDWVRNCRTACAGPARPYEPIRSISRAPSDHGKR